MHYTTEQIDLCRRLSEQLPKREPKVGEKWMVIFYRESYPAILDYYEGNGVWRCDHTRWTEELLHPLYSCGELLEMLSKYSYILFDFNEKIIDMAGGYVDIENNDILSALLKLAIEVGK